MAEEQQQAAIGTATSGSTESTADAVAAAIAASESNSNSTGSEQDTDQQNEDNQQIQVEYQVLDPRHQQQLYLQSQEDESEETKKTKSIAERFRDQVNQDEADSEKTSEIISVVQRRMQHHPKKNVLDRESERLIREQNEELQLECQTTMAGQATTADDNSSLGEQAC